MHRMIIGERQDMSPRKKQWNKTRAWTTCFHLLLSDFQATTAKGTPLRYYLFTIFGLKCHILFFLSFFFQSRMILLCVIIYLFLSSMYTEASPWGWAVLSPRNHTTYTWSHLNSFWQGQAYLSNPVFPFCQFWFCVLLLSSFLSLSLSLFKFYFEDIIVKLKGKKKRFMYGLVGVFSLSKGTDPRTFVLLIELLTIEFHSIHNHMWFYSRWHCSIISSIRYQECFLKNFNFNLTYSYDQHFLGVKINWRAQQWKFI